MNVEEACKRMAAELGRFYTRPELILVALDVALRTKAQLEYEHKPVPPEDQLWNNTYTYCNLRRAYLKMQEYRANPGKVVHDILEDRFPVENKTYTDYQREVSDSWKKAADAILKDVGGK